MRNPDLSLRAPLKRKAYRHRLARSALLLLCGTLLLTLSGCAFWRIDQSIELARRSEPLQQRPANPVARLLIVGDSTAVGTGASSPQASLAGLIAAAHPRLLIENRGRDGAKFADVLTQLSGDSRFDIVLVLAGGNDVVRMSDMDTLGADIDRVIAAAARLAPMVVLIPSGNVGNAPFFFPPLSWLMTRRSRQLHHLVAESAARHGAGYVNLFREQADALPGAGPSLFASDGLHPSDAGYRRWWSELRRQTSFDERLAPAGAG